ncbi:GNAT family N-acetyltransferase [Bailinhaonella thermotolerans]|uniref:GNAT family N-acetyltransferase n=1 Tax=Bailinhaonella thermotolerans TaxID=1070861 RepID=A0A3A4B4X0_9ACTN|nr:GNAT family N-acetyltransferase [Bailinhaonella thermotolerans]RJL33377.1 GNAT family N-acetyltransferase [Bailinhaonella thermotolerans]
MSIEREIAADAHGAPVFSYQRGVRDGRPWAHVLEPVGAGALPPETADLILERYRGWVFSVPVEMGEDLVRRGARLVRHAHVMERPPGGAGEAEPPAGFRFTPCDRPVADLLKAWEAAYPPGHPDFSGRSREAGEEELAGLLAGRLLGPLLPCSSLAVDGDGGVVAGVLVNDWQGRPWITEVFRHPEEAPRGLGMTLLRHALNRAAAEGLPAVGLAVTHGNSAARVYERLGFAVTDTSFTVLV